MSAKEVNYYRILGVRPDASQEDIKKRYRSLSKKHHPDANGGDGGRMALINEAYAVLSDPKRRHDYLPPSSSGPIRHTHKYQTHSPTTKPRKKAAVTQEPEPQPENWNFLWWYLLAIPIAIAIVTLGGPIYNKLFHSTTNSSATGTSVSK